MAVTCLGVRELLPELAIGVLSPAERDEVERHLRWCAGCRKEASELGQAAATFAFALAPVPVPQGLGEQIVERVRHVAGRPGTPRRARTTAASIVAAMVAVAGLGWGAAMAGRADRFEDRANRAEREAEDALDRFVVAIQGVIPPGRELPEDQFHLGRLAPTADGQGGGAVLQLVSPNILDFTMVIVNGLDPQATGRLPYRIRLLNAAGQVLRAGRITELDADGGAEVFHQFANKDLSGYSTVRVLDSAGVVVLTGGIESNPSGT
ncbi:MAG: zf-HC2 domain-containing protein [Actinomycetota bacterium]